MLPVEITDVVGWWSLVILLQVIIGSTYFLWVKRSKKCYNILTDEMLANWNPRPLIEEDVVEQESTIFNFNENTIDVGTMSFLSMNKQEAVLENAIKALNKYGVGSCGPRGFYGTIDVHLELEERLAKFLQVEETCVYSFGFSTIASAIPSYAKRGDIIFADENVWFAIQKGIDASKSTVRYFMHNNMKHLEELLSEAAKKKEINSRRRAFLIAEAIYFNTGEMCPLVELVRLARKYKLRIILDESLSIGVLGENGRGLTEHLNVPREEIDLIVGSLEHSFASVGGFCAGTHFIVEHQRLSGLGYCFSASMPPMLTQAAISALDILENSPHVLTELEHNSRKLDKALSQLANFKHRGDPLSPIKHVYIKRDDLTDILKHHYLKEITKYCIKENIALTVAAYLRDAEHNCPEPSIRVTSNRCLDSVKIDKLCRLLEEGYETCGPKPEMRPVDRSVIASNI